VASAQNYGLYQSGASQSYSFSTSSNLSYPFNVLIGQVGTIPNSANYGPSAGVIGSFSIQFQNLGTPGNMNTWTITTFLSDVGGDGVTNRLLFDTYQQPLTIPNNLENGLWGANAIFYFNYNASVSASNTPIYAYLSMTPTNPGDEQNFFFNGVLVTSYSAEYPTAAQ
jgi:hypothetical protein